jgi:acetyl esterase/lipase
MSWQARLLTWPLRLFVKPFLSRFAQPDRFALDPEVLTYLLRRPPFLRRVRGPGGLNWISAGPVRPGRVILYLHGGGYVTGSPAIYEGLLGELSARAEVEVCAPRYRLAPEHPFPAAFEDAVAAWRGLRRLGYAPGDIVLGGDSAGGGLALALLGHLCGRGTPPRAVFAFSPWTDLAMTGASLTENRTFDPLLPAERMGEVVSLYLGGARPDDPRASPLYARFPGCPPVLLQYGEDEILRDDSRRMAARLREFGARVIERPLPHVPHVWYLLDGVLPEAHAGLDATADFCRRAFEGDRMP